MREQIEAVQRMQDYIEAHLGEEITPADLARAALFSPWHACRLFTGLAGADPCGLYPPPAAVALGPAAAGRELPGGGCGL